MKTPTCPHCGSQNLQRRGRAKKVGYYRFSCNDCSKYSTISDEDVVVEDSSSTLYRETATDINIAASASQSYTADELIAKYAIDTDKWKLASYQVTTQVL